MGAESIHLPENLIWGKNQPDNKAGADNCIHMRVLKNASGIALFDKNCSDRYIVACEVIYIAHFSPKDEKKVNLKK
jgi:hypothetical protein